MSREFGVRSFKELLPQPGQDDHTEIAREQLQQTPHRDVSNILAEEIAVLTEIVRRTAPVAVDEHGSPKFASKGEFNDIKDAVRAELFSPRPANLVTQDAFMQTISMLTQQLEAVNAKLEEVSAAKPVRAKKEKADD